MIDPVLAQRVLVKNLGTDLIVDTNGKQCVPGWKIVRAGVQTGFEQRACWCFRQINNRCAGMMPAAGSAEAACTAQLFVLADAPELDQTNIPSSI